LKRRFVAGSQFRQLAGSVSTATECGPSPLPFTAARHIRRHRLTVDR
jgi:hypothetical protein